AVVGYVSGLVLVSGALDPKAPVAIVTGHGEIIRQADAGNSGKPGQPVLKSAIGSSETLRRIVLKRGIHLHHDSLVRAKTEMLALEVPQALGKQSRTGQQHEGQHSLRDHQDL